MVRIGNPDESTRRLYYFMWFQGGVLIRSVEADDAVPPEVKRSVYKTLAKTQAECGAFGREN